MAEPSAASIYESVRSEQEKFTELTKQLAQERISVANQLEKVRLSRDSGLAGSGYLDDGSNYRGEWNAEPTIPEDYENSDALDPVLVNRKVDTKVDKKVYRSERIQRRVIGDPGYCPDGSFYTQDEAPIHESRYTTTQTNSQPNADLNDNGSSDSDPNLVSRHATSTTTQEVTTVTKVYRTYERVPNETLSSGSRDYDYPEEYMAGAGHNGGSGSGDFDSQLYAKPYRKYGSPKRFDHVNGVGGAPHGNGNGYGHGGGAGSRVSNGDVYDRGDYYASSLASSAAAKGSRRAHHANLVPDDVGYASGSYMGDHTTSNGNGVGGVAYPGSSPVTVNGQHPHHQPDSSSHRGSSAALLPPLPINAPQYRDPELSEVIDFLKSPSNVIRANAAAHLAHLAYMNDQIKNTTRQLGGIPPLLEMLGSSIPEIQRNACSALRNLSFGRGNDENKKAIHRAGGLAALTKLHRHTLEIEVAELVTAILWILSSCEELKKPILDEACPLLIEQVILPVVPPAESLPAGRANGYARTAAPSYTSTVFRNSTGVLRNISSAGFHARKHLRDMSGLIGGLLRLVRQAVTDHDIDNKSIENVVCVLRNLSFRCQEVEDPDYDKKRPTTGKKGDKSTLNTTGNQNGTTAKNTTTSYTHLKGMEALWSIESVQSYLAVLSNCSNPDTLEATAGIVQNLSACYWAPAVDFRAAIRKEKALPVLVEIVRMDDDRLVCSVARALRNLAVDPRNRELIGKYAMRDLAARIPSGRADLQDLAATSDETIAAVLATVNEVVRRHQEFARAFVDIHGIDRLVYITTNYAQYSSKVVRFAYLLLQTLWAHHGLHDVYRAGNWKESHFLSKPPNMSVKTLGGSDTLGRTFSSQGPTKFEDKTLPRGALPPQEGDAEIPMAVMSAGKSRKSTGGTEPVYAQVNKQEKHRQRLARDNDFGDVADGSNHGDAEDVGGDSWV
ncbi:Juxtamembrane domain-associated catenin [Hypsibius exemplaris]|uniref:Juxtamembrane domain-associated catenin n=1 Tax=Hypsibius exemplaris TaxID=2072580 RepID=A0A1W0WH83_HYPEX|nr:Juxtamembrane domain-associated catenin [Hypsibius exemplaris]